MGQSVMTDHTPLPWGIVPSDPAEGVNCYWIKAQPSPALRGFTKIIGCIDGPQGFGSEREANAVFLATAVNYHEKLAKALAAYVADVPAFRSKPMGAPGSLVRIEQELHIKAEDTARALLAEIRKQ